MLMESFPVPPTRIMFFTGKGGVGKTTLACAMAVALADRGEETLLVCTDPASNLNEVLGTPIGTTATPVREVAHLWAINIDPQAAARRYREKVVGPCRGLLPETAIAAIEEQLSGACTTEIAAFDEFVKLLSQDQETGQYRHLLFDTAPTGHTLRLLALPAAWSHFMETNTTGTSCLGPLSGLQEQRTRYRAAMQRLADSALTTLVLVSTAQQPALAEAARSSIELAAQGLGAQVLAINGIFSVTDPADPVAVALAAEQHQSLSTLPAVLQTLPRLELPLAAEAVLGPGALRRFAAGRPLEAGGAAGICPAAGLAGCRDFGWMVEQLATRGRGLVMAMGKGGVGKTSLASALARALAIRGFPVQLTTTDPAAHLDLTLAERVGNLTVSVIDPVVETGSYRAEVLAGKGGGLDEEGRRLLEEDLRSPCTEEVAVFRAFARKVAQAGEGFVVLDTAPTGHTLLLLDATEAYHREVSRSASELPEAVRELLPRLRDPAFTSVLIVTLPEATPVQEAAQLQEDLRRAGIEPAAWVINRSLTPLAVRDPQLAARRRAEQEHIRRVRDGLARVTCLVGWGEEGV